MTFKKYSQSQHSITRKDIPERPYRILRRLYQMGHTAYLVGGGVRDLLLGRSPKDFDIATSARPSQVKQIFRNCRLIGRRFRLAHIYYGRTDIIEVATFRKDPHKPGEVDDLYVLDDNMFGTPKEDALRRDFTVNALFCDISDYSVIDYVGGRQDLHRGIIRTIRDPYVRFQEDPVRMLRAIKFANRLGFRIEERTFQAMLELMPELERSPLPRRQEELMRLWEEGSASDSSLMLWETKALKVLLPYEWDFLARWKKDQRKRDFKEHAIYKILLEIDKKFARGQRFDRGVYCALWAMGCLIEEGRWEELLSEGDRSLSQRFQTFLQMSGLPRKDCEVFYQTLFGCRKLCHYLEQKKNRLPKSLLGKSYFQRCIILVEIYQKLFASSESYQLWQEWIQSFSPKDEKSFVRRNPPKVKSNNRRRIRRRRT